MIVGMCWACVQGHKHDGRGRTDSSPKCLCKNLCLLHLGTIHLRPHHRAKRHLGPQLMRHGQRERSFARPWRTDEHERASREFA
jgi:hypothetical protein